jgi:integrase
MLTSKAGLQPRTKVCPECAEEVKWAARVCRFCRYEFAPPGAVSLHAQRDRQATLPRNFLGLVFASPRGTPLDARNVSRAFASDCERVGLPHMRLHDLRHTAASMMLGQGSTLDDIKRVLGHSSIALTSDTYGHLVEGRSREVADGMDRLLG